MFIQVLLGGGATRGAPHLHSVGAGGVADVIEVIEGAEDADDDFIDDPVAPIRRLVQCRKKMAGSTPESHPSAKGGHY